MRARQQPPHIQGIDLLIEQGFRHIGQGNSLGQAFRDRGFAHARLTNQDRVIFGAAAQDLHHALNFPIAPHHGIELVLDRRLGQVGAVGGQNVAAVGAIARGLSPGLAPIARGHRRRFPQQPNQVDPQLIGIHIHTPQHLHRRVVPIANNRQQQMLRSHHLLALLTRFGQGRLKQGLHLGRKRHFVRNHPRAATNQRFHPGPGPLQGDPRCRQQLSRRAGLFTQQTEQDLLTAHEAVAQAARFFLGEQDGLDGAIGKVLKHGAERGKRARLRSWTGLARGGGAITKGHHGQIAVSRPNEQTK